ncbi:MAG: aspartate/glutamate racemase family protein [Candidatus Saccharimonadales bacterium]
MKIGVFDSGIGGLSVANAIKLAFPEHEVIFKNDAKHVPYGSRGMDEVLVFTLPILQSLVLVGVDCIVIACNTVSTNLIVQLRNLLDVPLIAMEPMVKPAAQQTSTGVIAVCATPATLSSERYAWLKNTYASDIRVLEPDCSTWAAMIEANKVDVSAVESLVQGVIAQNADVIVLGCTHYHWIEALIKKSAGSRAVVLQPEQPVIAELRRVIAPLI